MHRRKRQGRSAQKRPRATGQRSATSAASPTKDATAMMADMKLEDKPKVQESSSSSSTKAEFAQPSPVEPKKETVVATSGAMRMTKTAVRKHILSKYAEKESTLEIRIKKPAAKKSASKEKGCDGNLSDASDKTVVLVTKVIRDTDGKYKVRTEEKTGQVAVPTGTKDKPAPPVPPRAKPGSSKITDIEAPPTAVKSVTVSTSGAGPGGSAPVPKKKAIRGIDEDGRYGIFQPTCCLHHAQYHLAETVEIVRELDPTVMRTKTKDEIKAEETARMARYWNEALANCENVTSNKTKLKLFKFFFDPRVRYIVAEFFYYRFMPQGPQELAYAGAQSFMTFAIKKDLVAEDLLEYFRRDIENLPPTDKIDRNFLMMRLFQCPLFYGGYPSPKRRAAAAAAAARAMQSQSQSSGTGTGSASAPASVSGETSCRALPMKKKGTKKVGKNVAKGRGPAKKK